MVQVAAKPNILPPPEKWRQMKKGSRCKVFSGASPFCPLQEVLSTKSILWKHLANLRGGEDDEEEEEEEEGEMKTHVKDVFFIPAQSEHC